MCGLFIGYALEGLEHHDGVTADDLEYPLAVFSIPIDSE
jgi:hypothetical protein